MCRVRQIVFMRGWPLSTDSGVADFLCEAAFANSAIPVFLYHPFFPKAATYLHFLELRIWPYPLLLQVFLFPIAIIMSVNYSHIFVVDFQARCTARYAAGLTKRFENECYLCSRMLINGKGCKFERWLGANLSCIFCPITAKFEPNELDRRVRRKILFDISERGMAYLDHFPALLHLKNRWYKKARITLKKHCWFVDLFIWSSFFCHLRLISW